LTRYGMRQIMNLPETGEVLTSCGWKQYQNPRITWRDAPLVEVVFRDGYTVRCTPDHLFKTESGWISAESLKRGIKIQSSLTRLRNISMVVFSVFGRKKDISLGEESIFTEWYGRLLSGRFLQSITSITETVIRPIMLSPILNVSIPPITQQSRRKVTQEFLKKPEMPLRFGTALPKEGHGIGVTLSELKDGRNGNGKPNHVFNVEKRSWRLFVSRAIRKSFAVIIAKPLIIERVNPLSRKEDTWCLTVPDVHEFSLTNGALVHNSSHAADAFRYGCVTEPKSKATSGSIKYPERRYA